MTRIVVEVSSDRNSCGILKVVDARGRKVCGPFKVAARANDALAAANGNPGRNPFFSFGDTPVGGYVVRQYIKSGSRTVFPAAQFGPHGVIVMEPVSGDAALAEANGRFHFTIGGGDLSKDGQLRSTAGGLRVENGDLRKILTALKQATGILCEVVDRGRALSRESVFVDDTLDWEDPIKLPVSRSASRAGGRDALRGSASAMVFGMTLSFAALPGAPAQAAQKPAVPTAWTSREQQASSRNVVQQDRLVPEHHYVQLAYGAPAQSGSYTATQPDTPPSTTGGGTNTIDGGGGQPISGAGVTTGSSGSGNTGAAPANSAMQQLQNATNGQQTTGQTFDNGRGVSDATPSAGNINVPTPSSGPVGGASGSGTSRGSDQNAGSGSTGSGGSSSSGGPNDGPINQITGGGQPISGPGIQYGRPDTPPPPNPGSTTISNDQSAVAAAQARVDAAIAQRNAATSDAARQQAQIDVYNATQQLNRANSQLRVDQIKGN